MMTLIPTVVLLVSLLPAPDQDRETFAPLDAALAARAARLEFAGVVAVARAGEVLHLGTFGEASIELGVAHVADTRFKLHSMSKPLLATVLLRTVDAGKLELDDHVGDILPAWPFPWSDVTVRHLLTHTSGLPDFAEMFLSEWTGAAGSTWRALAPHFASREPSAEPGSSWAYSNAGYVLLAAVLEEVWESPFEDVLAVQLTTPAGMESTELETTPPWPGISYDGHRVLGRLATGYNGTPEALQVAYSKMYAIPGAGGIVSDAGDLVTFTHALFQGDLLTPETREAMTTVAAGSSAPYALGWVVKEREGSPVYVHDGGNNGFVTSLEYYPESQVALVILCNLGYVPMGEVRDEIAHLALAALDGDAVRRQSRGR